jgi:RNA polymerase sigma-70 factor (ECF subfamily)
MAVAALGVRNLHPTPAAPSFADAATAHLDAVYRYALHLTRNVHQAEDVTSDTFERALRQWHTFDPARGPVLPWLVAIARRIALDQFRSTKRRIGREERYSAAEPVATPAPELTEFPEDMRAALGKLNDAEREVVALRVLLDLDGAETAALLGVTPSACSTTLHRAMTKLRKDLGT